MTGFGKEVGIAAGCVVVIRLGSRSSGFASANPAMFFQGLVELIAAIWRADSEIRESSILGESEMDRQSRRLMAWLCGGAIVLVVLAGVLWQWLTGGG